MSEYKVSSNHPAGMIFLFFYFLLLYSPFNLVLQFYREKFGQKNKYSYFNYRSRTSIPHMTVRKITCLLIDDDVDDQEIFMLALTQISDQFDCHVINNGYEALQQLKKQAILPDYIFLDLNMPRINGKECLKDLKKNDRLRNIPVIIYSTSSSLTDINDTRRLGAADFITKPFSIKHLIDALCSFFAKQGESIQVGVCK